MRRVFAFLLTRKDTVPPVRLLGLGFSQIVGLPTDTLGRVQPHDFDYELRRDAASPTIVVLQAGEINTGASGPFRALVPIAKNHGAWVHADGVFGLWAGVSPRFKHFVEGVEMADSWATDGHKWLNVPFDSGYAFVRDAEAHRAAMSHRAPYITANIEARDQIDWNPEWSRRARGFPVTKIGKLRGARVLCEPTINQGLVQSSARSRGSRKPGGSLLRSCSFTQTLTPLSRTDEVIAAIRDSPTASKAGGNGFADS